MSKHRRVCLDEMVRCSICGDSMRRSALVGHQKDPELITVHMMAMQQTIEGLKSRNGSLEKRVAMATSRDRERLVQELKAISTIEHVSRNSAFASAIEGIVGAEAWREMRAKRMETGHLLVELLNFPASHAKAMGESSSSIISAIMKALRRIIEDSREDPKEALVKIGAPAAIVRALRAFPIDLDAQEQVWLVVAALVEESKYGRAMSEAVDAGIYKAALSALLAFPSSEFIQKLCGWVICEAGQERGTFPGHYEEIGKPSCEAVVAALNAFPANAAIQANGCATVQNLISDDQCQSLLLDLGACQAVIKALTLYPDNLAVQRNGILALAYQGGDDSASLIGEGGGCEAIVAALKAFPDDQNVQGNGCWAIRNLVMFSNDNRRKLSSAGGCQAITAALGQFLGNESVQNFGWQVVSFLADRAETNINFLEAEGCEAIMASLKAFPGNVAVQLIRLSAVSLLAKEGEGNKAKLIAAGVLGAVTEAMRFFPQEESVQETGRSILRFLQT